MSEKTNNTHTSLSDTFGIDDVIDVTPKESSSQLSIVAEKPEPNGTYEDDAEAVRKTLYNLLKEGEEAFGDLKRIAIAEESPRSFEVLNSMLTNISDIAVKLLEVHEKKEKIRKSSTPTGQDGIVNNGVVNNNTVFVGTTKDLQAMIKNLKMDDQ